MPQTACAFCNFPSETTEALCRHCARPAKQYPNVLAAQEEAEAVETRYRGALQPFHTEELIAKFDELITRGRAVMACQITEAFRVALDDYEMVQSNARRVRAGFRTYRLDPKWDRWRNDADSVLFPGYRDQIHFAALSLDGRGLARYGRCRLIFNEEMIKHRSTVFERNSAAWVRDAGGDAHPAGLRATWDQRARVAFAKLAAMIASDADLEDLPRTILVDEPEEADDQMIEVHIWGPLTARSCEKIVIPREEYEKLRGVLDLRLQELGVELAEN